MRREREGRQRPKARQFMWPRYALYLGGIGKTEWHAHYMIQVVFSLDRPFKIRHEKEGGYQETRGVIVPSEVGHQVRVWRGRTVIIWLDPEGEDGRHFTGNDFIPIDETLLERWADQLPKLYEAADACQPAQQLIDTIIADLTARREAERPLDERIQAVASHIEHHLVQSDSAELAIGRLAEIAHLSESRLMHLFRQEMGLTVRRYIFCGRGCTRPCRSFYAAHRSQKRHTRPVSPMPPT